MNPAWSVLLLTTLIGLGQGLFLALFTVQSYALFGLLPSPAAGFYGVGSALALLALALGLVASFFHLGRPERAWRAAAMWRTSWLSREVIALPVTMGLVLLYGATHASGVNPVLGKIAPGVVVDASVVLGTLGTLAAFALFACTAMIYASVRFLREWATPLTLLNYTLLGGASGFSAASAFAASTAPGLARFLAGWALVLTLLGGIGRTATLVRNARLRPHSTLQTAIGIKHPQIVQKARGFLGGAYALREFFHGRTPATVRAVQWTFLLAAFALPALLLAVAAWAGATLLLLPAALVQYTGLLAERWHFFAQARHPQNLYYQSAT